MLRYIVIQIGKNSKLHKNQFHSEPFEMTVILNFCVLSLVGYGRTLLETHLSDRHNIHKSTRQLKVEGKQAKGNVCNYEPNRRKKSNSKSKNGQKQGKPHPVKSTSASLSGISLGVNSA